MFKFRELNTNLLKKVKKCYPETNEANPQLRNGNKPKGLKDYKKSR